MHILITDETTESSRNVASSFRERGHEVHTCRDGEHPGCAGLRGGRCPLDTLPIDLVVGTGTNSREHADLRHEGILCGARRRLPIMFVGIPPDDLLPPWVPLRATRSQKDAVDVAEQVVASPLPMHSALATEVLREGLTRDGTTTRGASAEVHRRDGGLRVDLVVDDSVPLRAREALTVLVHAALREMDPWSSTCDIGISTAPGGPCTGTPRASYRAGAASGGQ